MDSETKAIIYVVGSVIDRVEESLPSSKKAQICNVFFIVKILGQYIPIVKIIGKCISIVK